MRFPLPRASSHAAAAGSILKSRYAPEILACAAWAIGRPHACPGEASLGGYQGDLRLSPGPDPHPLQEGRDRGGSGGPLHPLRRGIEAGVALAA
jgi:hypothetical protein